MQRDSVFISPSIASANPLCLEREAQRALAAGCTDLHIDIEDGNFIPNITFGIKTVRALRAVSPLPFSFHLMTAAWPQWLADAALLNPSIVFAHLECLPYPKAFIAQAKRLGVRCGLALNPRTQVAGLEYLVEQLDGVLLLSAEPDGAGECFIPQTLQKAAQVRQLSPTVELWLDGNVRYERLPALSTHGVTHAVMGRQFFAEER